MRLDGDWRQPYSGTTTVFKTADSEPLAKPTTALNPYNHPPSNNTRFGDTSGLRCSKTGFFLTRLPTAPKLKRRQIILPGSFAPASVFSAYAQNLAKTPGNGPVVVYRASDRTFRLDSYGGRVLAPHEIKNAKIFIMQYSNIVEAPSVKAREIEQMIKDMRGTGPKAEMDMIGHSCGCMDFLRYVKNCYESGVHPTPFRQITFIAPPLNGVHLANRSQGLARALGWKTAEQTAIELAYGSRQIAEIRDFLPTFRGFVRGNIAILATQAVDEDGRPINNTRCEDGSDKPGDGLMVRDSMQFEGADTVIINSEDRAFSAHSMQPTCASIIELIHRNTVRGD